VGIIRTKGWKPALGLAGGNAAAAAAADTNGAQSNGTAQLDASTHTPSRLSNLLRSVIQHQIPHAQHHALASGTTEIWDIALGAETEGVARGLFSALRELDKKGVEIIFVEGIDDALGDDIAAAVMNRLRKAAEIRV
jgi:L-threonylcarbamoyladenylate synthase